MTKIFTKALAGGAIPMLLFGPAMLFMIESAAAEETTANVESNARSAQRGFGRIDTLILHDAARNKDLQCRVTYPSKFSNPCPIVIFSHGAMGSKDAYDYLVDYLSGHGYVCIQPNHADSMKLADKWGRLSQARETLSSLPHNAGAWDNRAKDISLIIDSLAAIQKQVPVHLNTNSIACAGHSLGAFTSALIGGAEPPPPATRKNYFDKRVGVAIMISPQGVRKSEKDFGFADRQAWQRLSIPCLFMTGTLDNTKWTSYEDRQTPFLSSPAGGKYLAVVKGASHMTFAGIGNGGMVGDDSEEGGKARPFRQYLTRQLSKSMTPDQGGRTAMLDDICKITTCFLDAYLKQNPQAKDELATAHAFGDLVDMKVR